MFVKPDLTVYFNAMPLIGQWIKAEYNQANSLDDLVSLFHRWIGVAESTINETKAECYRASAYYIYSLITNRSYESKI